MIQRHVDKVVPDGATSFHVGVQFHQGREHVGSHPGTRDAEEKHTPVEDDADGAPILRRIELVSARSVLWLVAEPHNGNLFDERVSGRDRDGTMIGMTGAVALRAAVEEAA